jgi:hypothetical protein
LILKLPHLSVVIPAAESTRAKGQVTNRLRKRILKRNLCHPMTIARMRQVTRNQLKAQEIG